MYFQSIAPVWSQTFVNNVLSAFGARPAGALMPQTNFALFTSAPAILQPSNVSTLTFTEADFPGYARVAGAVVNHPVAFPGNSGWGVHATGRWVASAGLTPPGQTVLGYWAQSTLGVVYAAEYFPQPFTFANPFDYLAFTWAFGLAFAPIVGYPVTSPRS